MFLCSSSFWGAVFVVGVIMWDNIFAVSRFLVYDCLPSIGNFISSYPIFLIGIGIFVTGAVIGLGYRLIRG